MLRFKNVNIKAVNLRKKLPFQLCAVSKYILWYSSPEEEKIMETWKSFLSVSSLSCRLLTTLGRKVVFLIRTKSSVLIRVCNASSTLVEVEPYKREVQCRYFVSYRKSCCIHYITNNATPLLEKQMKSI